MVVPPEEQSEGVHQPPYESFGGQGVEVNINDLVTYFMEMQKIQMAATGPATIDRKSVV